MGKVPQNFENVMAADPKSVDVIKDFHIALEFLGILVWKRQHLSESLRWLWHYVVGRNVLEPFGLYQYRFSIFGENVPWRYEGSKSFSLSSECAKHNIFNKPNHPPEDSFTFSRTAGKGRPFLIVHTNIAPSTDTEHDYIGAIQIPVQSTAVSTGSLGEHPVNPDDVIGGGSAKSFAYTSLLKSPTGNTEATVGCDRRYSLTDIAACSSAFYAEALLKTLATMVEDMGKGHFRTGVSKMSKHAGFLTGWIPGHRAHMEKLKSDVGGLGLTDLVPQYNYWPVGLARDGASGNRDVYFTDGGDLENTGVLGMLAQTQVDSVIAFVNTLVALEKKDHTIIAVAQASPLYGIAFDEKTSQFKPYEPNGVNPFTGEIDPSGFLQVFDNSNDEFQSLREGLYKANGEGQSTGPAFFKQSLTVIDNKLAGVTARPGPVTVLWVQNARVNDWQNQITDTKLCEAIEEGQKQSGKSFAPFANFPYYNTMSKIHQTEAETNTLAQLWTWCVADGESPLSAEIKALF
ncbi:MAG: hypothetical protein CMJ78_12725 [Planctomycetaceae bacterium]|nr:hypothetical protein [Planctomycetaceae bacterium]